jgi:hypothetical protein
MYINENLSNKTFANVVEFIKDKLIEGNYKLYQEKCGNKPFISVSIPISEHENKLVCLVFTKRGKVESMRFSVWKKLNSEVNLNQLQYITNENLINARNHYTPSHKEFTVYNYFVTSQEIAQ